MRRHLASFALTLLASSLAQAATPVLPPATNFNLLPYTPYTVTNDGSMAAGDNINTDSVWIWSNNGNVQNIGGVSSINTGTGTVNISGDGSKVAAGYLYADGVRRASIYSPATGQWTPLSGLGGYSLGAGLSSDPNVNMANYNATGSAWGISNNGQFVVGQAYQVGNGSSNSRATVWNLSTGTVTNLGNNPGITSGANSRTRANSVSNDGKVIGGSGANFTPLVWTDFDGDGTYSAVNVITASGLNVNSVLAVSANGQWAVGQGFTGTGNGSAYRFNTSTNQGQLLGKLNSASGGADSATAVNADGSVIVGYENDASAAAANRTGFIWTSSGGMQSLDAYLAGYGIDTGNTFNFTTPIGISADGRSIVGFGYAPGSQTAVGFEVTIPSAVPEASTYAMMLAGLGAVGFVARRRKAAARA